MDLTPSSRPQLVAPPHSPIIVKRHSTGQLDLQPPVRPHRFRTFIQFRDHPLIGNYANRRPAGKRASFLLPWKIRQLSLTLLQILFFVGSYRLAPEDFARV